MQAEAKLSAVCGRRKHHRLLSADFDALLHCRCSVEASTMQTHVQLFEFLHQASSAAQLFLMAHSHATL